jgi:hypothetical protein
MVTLTKQSISHTRNDPLIYSETNDGGEILECDVQKLRNEMEQQLHIDRHAETNLEVIFSTQHSVDHVNFFKQGWPRSLGPMQTTDSAFITWFM